MKLKQPGPNDLVVDNTILSSVAECETRAYVEHAVGLVPKVRGLALEAGQALHAMLAVFLPARDRRAMARGLAQLEGYRTVVEAAIARGEEVPGRYGADRVQAIGKQWMERNIGGNFPFLVFPKLLERSLAVPMRDRDGDLVSRRETGARVWYSAKLDAAVRRAESGVRWSMDHKTCVRATDWKIEKWKSSSQFTGQVYVIRRDAERRGEDDPQVGGVIVNAIELPDPHTSDRKCPTHRRPYTACSVQHAGGTYVYVTRTAAEEAAWLDTAVAMVHRFDRLLTRGKAEGIEGVEAMPMRGRFTGACAFCDMKKWCDAGRPIGQRVLDITFRPYQWDPLTGEE